MIGDLVREFGDPPRNRKPRKVPRRERPQSGDEYDIRVNGDVLDSWIHQRVLFLRPQTLAEIVAHEALRDVARSRILAALRRLATHRLARFVPDHRPPGWQLCIYRGPHVYKPGTPDGSAAYYEKGLRP
jgi:hypothetical protein